MPNDRQKERDTQGEGERDGQTNRQTNRQKEQNEQKQGHSGREREGQWLDLDGKAVKHRPDYLVLVSHTNFPSVYLVGRGLLLYREIFIKDIIRADNLIIDKF